MLNPVAFTERVVSDFLRYELSTHSFADPNLQAQFRRLLSLEETRATPLLKGPFISLSRAFRTGAASRTSSGKSPRNWDGRFPLKRCSPGWLSELPPERMDAPS